MPWDSIPPLVDIFPDCSQSDLSKCLSPHQLFKIFQKISYYTVLKGIFLPKVYKDNFFQSFKKIILLFMLSHHKIFLYTLHPPLPPTWKSVPFWARGLELNFSFSSKDHPDSPFLVVYSHTTMHLSLFTDAILPLICVCLSHCWILSPIDTWIRSGFAHRCILKHNTVPSTWKEISKYLLIEQSKKSGSIMIPGRGD